MTILRALAVFLVGVTAAAAYAAMVATTAAGPWDLYKGTRKSGAYPSEAACVAAAVAKGIVSDYTCLTRTKVQVRTAPVVPPLPAVNPANAMVVSDASGLGMTDHPLTFGRPFLSGEIKGTPVIYADGVPIETQSEIQQRWQDGSVRYAVFSVVLAKLAPSGSITFTFGAMP